MITSRTPLRISFFGGGSDYPQWFKEHGGAVLATTIDKYCYISLHAGKVWHTFDLPNKSGLGSSSAYTVGLLRACTSFDQKTIARLATVWETDKLGGNIGVQDQLMCSLGGFRLLRFTEQDTKDTIIEPGELINYLMLFNTHIYRKAGMIVEHQLHEMKKHKKSLFRMVEIVEDGVKSLKTKDYIKFGQLLDESWHLKSNLSRYISNTEIDKIYNLAKANGAIGGKILGAGGGGFMLIFVEPDKQNNIKTILKDYDCVPFEFENEGTKIIYRD